MLRASHQMSKKETPNEPGANDYFFLQDENYDENTIVSYEKWESAEAESAHWKTPPLTGFEHLDLHS